MKTATGTLIGPYEIIGWIGAGGMGEVYRARDSRLGRDVAIKLLSEAFATDANRLNRFEQEARAAVLTPARPTSLRNCWRENRSAAVSRAGHWRRAKPSTTRVRSRRGSPLRTTRASSTAT